MKGSGIDGLGGCAGQMALQEGAGTGHEGHCEQPEFYDDVIIVTRAPDWKSSRRILRKGMRVRVLGCGRV